jgi:hypothetical protein
MHVVLVCGSRGWTDAGIVAGALAWLRTDSIIVHGNAAGADTLASDEARRRGLWVAYVPVEQRHWRRYGKRAGMERNAAMLALNIKEVIAFHDGVSPGTAGAIAMAVARKLPVTVYYADGSTRTH